MEAEAAPIIKMAKRIFGYLFLGCSSTAQHNASCSVRWQIFTKVVFSTSAFGGLCTHHPNCILLGF